MKVAKKAAVKLSHHTHVTYLMSTSLSPCNLKNGFKNGSTCVATGVSLVNIRLLLSSTSDFCDTVSYNANAELGSSELLK